MPAEPTPDSDRPTSPVWILVVEDNVPVRLRIVRYLRRLGFEVDSTANPFEALALLVASYHTSVDGVSGTIRGIDLVLVDHDLQSPGLDLVSEDRLTSEALSWRPLLSGAELVRAIHALHEAPPSADVSLPIRVPMIGISAVMELNQRMIHAGASTALRKATWAAELLPAIHRVLGPLGYALPSE